MLLRGQAPKTVVTDLGEFADEVSDEVPKDRMLTRSFRHFFALCRPDISE